MATLPARTEAFTVFAQQTDTRLDVPSWRGHAERFFGGTVEDHALTSLEIDPQGSREARVVFSDRTCPLCTRSVFVRLRTDDDLEAAVAAERSGDGGAGLSTLAKRCGVVILVVTEAAPDPDALFLSAVIAGVALGPILTPGQDHLWGVNTARRKLDEMRRA
jgi:hypothetical protein